MTTKTTFWTGTILAAAGVAATIYFGLFPSESFENAAPSEVKQRIKGSGNIQIGGDASGTVTNNED